MIFTNHHRKIILIRNEPEKLVDDYYYVAARGQGSGIYPEKQASQFFNTCRFNSTGEKIDLAFLDDIEVHCEMCNGSGFSAEV